MRLPSYAVLPVAVPGVAGVVAQPSPGPAPQNFETYEVSPGLIGFIPVFLIALASVLLFLSLTRHLRRVTVRGAARDAADAASPGAAAGDGPATGGGSATGGGPATGRGRDATPGTGTDPDPDAPRPGAGGPRRP